MNTQREKQKREKLANKSATEVRSDAEPLLTKDEERALLDALSSGASQMGLTGFTADEAEAVWAWAEQVRIRSALLDFALMGSVSSVVREDGELVFHQADNAKQPAKKLK